MEFGDRLKLLRNKLDTTQKEMAKKIGVDRSTWTGYEKNARNPSLNLLNKIADETKCNLHWLLTGKGEIFISDHPPEEEKKDKRLKELEKENAELRESISTLKGENIEMADKLRERLNEVILLQEKLIKGQC